MGSILAANPIATVSAVCFYAVLALLCVPWMRLMVLPQPKHKTGVKHEHFAGFDTYRGLAALYVAIAHMWLFTFPVFANTQLAWHWIAYGSAAVPVFCVLSGFLIYRTVSAISDT